jgi:hypothetical protein
MTVLKSSKACIFVIFDTTCTYMPSAAIFLTNSPSLLWKQNENFNKCVTLALWQLKICEADSVIFYKKNI